MATPTSTTVTTTPPSTVIITAITLNMPNTLTPLIMSVI
jgi:hypothetical protein